MYFYAWKNKQTWIIDEYLHKLSSKIKDNVSFLSDPKTNKNKCLFTKLNTKINFHLKTNVANANLPNVGTEKGNNGDLLSSKQQ